MQDIAPLDEKVEFNQDGMDRRARSAMVHRAAEVRRSGH